MHAVTGDWLVVRGSRGSVPDRRAEILSTGPEGRPPYEVRWTDTGREGLVFPGPDSFVITAADELRLERLQVERALHNEEEIAARQRRLTGRQSDAQ